MPTVTRREPTPEERREQLDPGAAVRLERLATDIFVTFAAAAPQTAHDTGLSANDLADLSVDLADRIYRRVRGQR